ncbi:hypothetical protein ABZV67_41770 [Streptomyces sp. NPDC005065]|uniref:WD40/YVTN/BNR-like repeat-containing protein n=1 Tax=Streptomyces sp. NPDC005065 TaxID=3154461 RepID=UPI0033AFCB27
MRDGLRRTTLLGIGTFNVERSTDSGATWTVIGGYDGYPNALMVDPANPEHVTVAYGTSDSTGLYTTGDGGKTWKVLHQDRAYTEIKGDPAHPGRLWLGSVDGLYRSDDGGGG